LAKRRLLFVDDEENIRITLPEILRQAGFEVAVAGTVPEALERIHREQFDVLISDLNIGEPGDGFTVVSAMRRSQPEAVTFILTGFPDFDTALKAIRSQVDDYLVKPTHPARLIETVNATLSHKAAPNRPRTTHRVSYVIRDNREIIARDWIKEVKSHPELAAIPLSDDERIDYLPDFLDELAARVADTPDTEPTTASRAAIHHGEVRFRQGYTIPQIVAEARLLHRVLAKCLQENLLSIDISSLIPDMIHIGESLAASIEQSIRAFQRASREAQSTTPPVLNP
jgi:ActR/RegA family two-component response regulator